MSIETDTPPSDTQPEEEQFRKHWPFVRAPLKPQDIVQYILPVYGIYKFRKETLKLQAPIPKETEVSQTSKVADLATLFVTTWPEPKTTKEGKEHVKTQALHGTMVAYHGIILPVLIVEAINLMLRAK